MCCPSATTLPPASACKNGSSRHQPIHVSLCGHPPRQPMIEAPRPATTSSRTSRSQLAAALPTPSPGREQSLTPALPVETLSRCGSSSALPQHERAPGKDDDQEHGETPAYWQRSSPGAPLCASARCRVGRQANVTLFDERMPPRRSVRSYLAVASSRNEQRPQAVSRVLGEGRPSQTCEPRDTSTDVRSAPSAHEQSLPRTTSGENPRDEGGGKENSPTTAT